MRMHSYWVLPRRSVTLAGRNRARCVAALRAAGSEPHQLSDRAGGSIYRSGPPRISARDEIVRGIRGMLGRTLRIESGDPEGTRDPARHAGRVVEDRPEAEARTISSPTATGLRPPA